jgi:hypothetical protein
MINFGYVREDSTVNIPFSTNDAAGGAVAPSTAFEAADIVIYKDGGATQKTSTNGLTMTSPFDAITGLHQIDIDTSNDTGDAGFWANGSSYAVILSPDETVDSQTVVAVLATFTLDSDAADESTGSPVKVHTDKGFYDEDATVIIPFVTRNSDGLCTPDSVAVSVYKDDSTTEKSTANGITATIDFDGVTGKHLLVIDTSNNTGDLGFWTADSEYHVDITVTSPSALYNHPDIINIVGVSFIIGTQSVSVSDKTGFSLSADQSSVTIGTVNSIAGTITTLDALDTAQDTQHGLTRTDISGLNDIAATDIVSAGAITTLSGAVVNVDTVDTVTTNNDMRGTDSALLASSAPANFGDLAITATTGLTSVGTNNDKASYSISGTKTTLDSLNDIDGTGLTVDLNADQSAVTIGTVTTNSDMRGTDSALLASAAPANFSDMDITVTTGKVTVGTNDDKTGYSISGSLTTLDALDTAQDTQHGLTRTDIGNLNDIAATDIVSNGAITTLTGAVSTVTNVTNSVDLNANQSGVTIGTVTTNSDMRGTDSAFLAASAPSNFSVLGINVSGHLSRATLVDTTTANTDMRGTDSANTIVPDNASITAILNDTNELQTDDIPGLIGALNDIDGTGLTVDLNANQSGVTIGIVGTITNNVTTDSASRTASQADISSLATASALATVDSNVDAILTDTNELQTDDIPGLISALNDPTVAEIADGVWDELTSGHNTQGTFGRSIKKLYEGLVSAEAAIDDLSATTTSFVTDLTETTDGHYHDSVIAFVTGNLTGSAAVIGTYNGTTKTITLDEELVEAPANGDEFIILTTHVHAVTDIASGIWGNASRTLSSAANITSDSGVINVTSGVVEANIKEINDSSLAATRIALSAAQIIPGTVDTSLVAPTTTSFESDDITEATTGHYNGRVIIFTSGALLGQAVSITGYVLNGSNGVFTVSTMTESPADNVTFIIV